MKNIALLGSTGSIGKNTLEVVRNNPDKLRIISLTAGKNWKLLAEQAREFKPKYVAIADTKYENELKSALADTNTIVKSGEEAVIEAVTINGVDTVLAAIVGAAGLNPAWEAINQKHLICLANKETLVVAGELVMNAVKKNNIKLVPVDSEHSAIFQCLQGASKTPLHRIIITASGGPFRTLPKDDLNKVTVEQALKHPNWNMGGKITIDSATLMNKGLEVIEAHWLFDATYEQIDIVVHPQSLIHSLVEFSDGSVIGQLGWPDMKLPIQYALTWPERWNPPLPKFDLIKAGTMSFFEPRYDDFPCLKIAFNAGKEGGIMPCVMNAANEIAVRAFMQKKIGFMQIPEVISNTIDSFKNEPIVSIDQLITLDAESRLKAEELIDRL